MLHSITQYYTMFHNVTQYYTMLHRWFCVPRRPMRRLDGCPSSYWWVWDTLHKDASGKVLKVCTENVLHCVPSPANWGLWTEHLPNSLPLLIFLLLHFSLPPFSLLASSSPPLSSNLFLSLPPFLLLSSLPPSLLLSSFLPSSCIIESVTDYFLMVLAGLAGSCHMISATILALARLVYEFYGRCAIMNVYAWALSLKT